MFYAFTFSNLNRSTDSTSISRNLVKCLEELKFFGIGNTSEIIPVDDDGEVDEEGDPWQVVILTPDVRQEFIVLLTKEIIAEATKAIGIDILATRSIESTKLYTLKTLIKLKQMVENDSARYLSFKD